MVVTAACLALSMAFPGGARGASVASHPRRLLVRTDARFERVDLAGLHPELGIRELWNLPQIGWRAIELPAGRREVARAALSADPRVLAVEPDVRRRVALTPNDTFFPSQWHMLRIAAPAAWDTTTGSSTVRIAVVDTGVELSHADLAANLWTNPGETAGNGLDDDGNGYVDDVHGYDFANFDSDPSDDHSHGTACAGIAAAVQGNALGVTGVAPGCRIVAVKAGLASGFFFASANVPALVYCADMGFEVMSMSFYSDEVVPAERDAIAYCWAQGVLPVVAAGNENSVLPFYPAAYPQSLSVGATIDASDARAFFSNWGSWVNVAAPGWGLWTTVPGSGYTAGFAGTSGAAPHVAGIAALLFSANPAATNASVRAAIEDSSSLLVQAPYGAWSGYGRVDADAALDRILGITTGSVPARLAFAAPCGGTLAKRAARAFGEPARVQEIELHGVGLESPNTVLVKSGVHALPLRSQERHTVRVAMPPNPGPTLELRRNASLVQAWTWERTPGLLYAATDGSTNDTSGSSALGGWTELHREDGASFTCTENSGGVVACEFALRRVNVASIASATLEFRRRYTGMLASPVETVEVYDWSSASYPYGSWVTLASGPAPAGFSTLSAALPGDPDLLRDEEGTFYLRVTTTNAGASALLEADLLRLRVF
jgi:hypothetical protein